MFTSDYKKHKQQMDEIRLFAKELGKIPGGKSEGVGIPSLSLAVKGNFGIQADSILGKKLTHEQEKKEAFSLNEEINPKELKEKAQEFLLGLIEEEDFSDYLNRISYLVDTEFMRYQHRPIGSSMSGWQEELAGKDLLNKIMEALREGLKKLGIYLIDKEEKYLSEAMGLISSAEDLIKKRNKPEFTLPQADEEIVRAELKSQKALLAESSVLKENAASSVMKEAIREPAQQNFSISPPPQIQNQPYMMSAPTPSWHSHYDAKVTDKLKGFDLAYLSPLFKNLTFRQLDEICSKISVEKYNRGYTLFKEREDGEKFYIIKSGKVSIYKSEETGEEKEIITLSAGEILGEISMVDGGAYAFSARIYSEGTILISVSKNEFREFLIKYPWLSQNLSSICSLRLRDLYNKLATS